MTITIKCELHYQKYHSFKTIYKTSVIIGNRRAVQCKLYKCETKNFCFVE